MKKNLRVLYFYAYWDGNFGGKDLFKETCRALHVPFEAIDCETEDGVELSTKYGVKLPVTILFLKDGKEIGRARGKNAYLEIQNYVK